MENSVDVPASSDEGVSESESSEEEDGLRLDLIRCKSSTRCHTISAEEVSRRVKLSLDTQFAL